MEVRAGLLDRGSGPWYRRTMRQTFSCGHKGKGKYCHRCAQEAARIEQAAASAALAKTLLPATKLTDAVSTEGQPDDPIDLSALQKSRREKARRILAQVRDGKPYWQLGGSRWESNHAIVVIPLGRDFRLVFHDRQGELVPHACLTHEAYNNMRH